MGDVKIEAVGLVTEFMGKDGTVVHEALLVESHFDEDKCKFEEKKRHHDLKDMLAQYKKHADEGLDFDPARCAWDTMIQTMKAAQEASEEAASGKGLKKFGRRMFREAGKISEVISPAFQMLPDDLCVLHGGLAVMFNIARHRSDNRHKIMLAFGDIPNIIEMAEQKLKSFPDEQKLEDSIESLRSTLFQTIPALIGILIPKTLAARLKGPFARLEIEKLLDVVKSSADQVRVCAEAVRDNLLAGIHATTKDYEGHIHSIQETTEGTGIEVRQMSRTLSEVQETQQQFFADAVRSQNAMFQFLRDEVLKWMCEREEQARVPQPNGGRYRPQINLRELLGLLALDPMEVAHELGYMSKQDRGFDPASVAQAASLLLTTQFRDWLSGQRSAVILVQNDIEPSRTGKISPLSYIGANLSIVFKEVGLSLSFFCGQHLEPNKGLNGPQAMIHSLLAQLTALVVNDGGHPILEVLEGLVVSDELRALTLGGLCGAFRLLVQQLPVGIPVFCIVDGISWFDRVKWREEYAFAMDCLMSLADDRSSGSPFKLLVTSPTRSPWMESRLRQDQHVSLRRGVGRAGPVSERAIFKTARDTMISGSGHGSAGGQEGFSFPSKTNYQEW